MPTPTIRPNDEGVFYAVWSDNRRSKRKSLGTKDRAVAEQRFAQWLLLGGHKQAPEEGRRAALTIAELWMVYDEKHVQREVANPAGVNFLWKNLKIHFAELTLADISPDSIDRYVGLRAAGKIGRPSGPSTVRKELSVMRACFNWHASPKRKPRLVEKSEIPDFDLPAEGPPRDRWLTMDEIGKLFASAARLRVGPRLSRGERFLWLALETASRKQAILDLTWDRVDFEIGVIHYNVPGRKETKKRRVSVPISNTLRPVLQRMHDERINDRVLDNGGSVWATVQIIVERSGIVPPRLVKRANGQKPAATGISPHTLRHTAATQMARRGVPLFDIAGILGNTFAMVEKVYSHHCPGRLRAAVDSISGGMLEAAE